MGLFNAAVGIQICHQLDLLRELNDVKRLYAQNTGTVSYASLVFQHATKSLETGGPLRAEIWSSAIISSARLGAITPAVLENIGLDESARLVVLRNSISAHQSLSPTMSDLLSKSCVDLEKLLIEVAPVCEDWVERLCAAPRAGATCPGKPRIALEPAEMHSDHCMMVAVYGYLLAESFGADAEDVWLIALCHHFHNAYLPDAGFTGEILLGDYLEPVITSLRNRACTRLSEPYQSKVIQLFEELNDLTSPVAQTFHAADTIDRIVQMEHYERAARFKVAHAMNDFNLVHEGSAQAFQQALLKSIGMAYETVA